MSCKCLKTTGALELLVQTQLQMTQKHKQWIYLGEIVSAEAVSAVEWDANLGRQQFQGAENQMEINLELQPEQG
jgi:hypothetical protein